MKKSILKLTMFGVGAVFYHKFARPINAIIFGNLPRSNPSSETLNPRSLLYGKQIGFLGSSVTYGAAAGGNSFVEYLQAKDGVIPTKSAISGTTLAGLAPKTYTSRLREDFDQQTNYDAFVCQLSTNDGRAHKKMGRITPDSQTTQFDRDTTIGAIEDILAYVQAHFNCPVVFYTCVRKADQEYAELVRQLYALQAKWSFYILDLWADPVVKAAIARTPNLMADDAHPTKMGYKQLWTPLFEQKLLAVLNLGQSRPTFL